LSIISLLHVSALLGHYEVAWCMVISNVVTYAIRHSFMLSSYMLIYHEAFPSVCLVTSTPLSLSPALCLFPIARPFTQLLVPLIYLTFICYVLKGIALCALVHTSVLFTSTVYIIINKKYLIVCVFRWNSFNTHILRL
jgi:hypothetical protein